MGDFKKGPDGWYLSDKGNRWLPFEQVPEPLKGLLKRQPDYCRYSEGFYYSTKDSGNGKITVYKNDEAGFKKWKDNHPNGIIEGLPQAPPAGDRSPPLPAVAKSLRLVDIKSVKIGELSNDADAVILYEFIKGECRDGFRPWGNNPNEAIKDGRFWLVKEAAA